MWLSSVRAKLVLPEVDRLYTTHAQNHSLGEMSAKKLEREQGINIPL